MCDHGFWQHLPILCMHLELLAVAIADSKTIKICKQAGAHSTDSTFLNKTVDCPIHVYSFDFGSPTQAFATRMHAHGCRYRAKGVGHNRRYFCYCTFGFCFSYSLSAHCPSLAPVGAQMHLFGVNIILILSDFELDAHFVALSFNLLNW